MTRRARTKLPNEINKKLAEWKFSCGAQILCFITFPEGDRVRGFQ
jgi:hypothetical protein